MSWVVRLNFIATLPVKPDRAQEILFGASLRSYLYGQHITRPLVDKAKCQPAVILVDDADALELQAFVKTPLAWFESPNIGDSCVDVDAAEGQQAKPATNDQVFTGMHIAPIEQGPETDQTASDPPCDVNDAPENDAPEVDQLFRRDAAGFCLAFPQEPPESDRPSIDRAIGDLTSTVSLEEPFQRIEEAIREAYAVAS